MKKYIFTESQIKLIVNNLINEQDVRSARFNQAIQCFLNSKFKKNLKIDGMIGENTKQLIESYQQMLGIDTDGIWGEQTINTMKSKFPNDYAVFNKCVKTYKVNQLFIP